MSVGGDMNIFGYFTTIANNLDVYGTTIANNLTVNGTFSQGSDRRLKDNIENTKYGLETILKLEPVDYILKSNGQAKIGFIAQDVKPLVPEAIHGIEGDIEKRENLSISYTTIIPILTKAIQEQQQQLETQQNLIQSLLERLETLENK